MGYDSGAYQHERCLCADFYDYDYCTEKKLKIRVNTGSSKELPKPYEGPWY